MIETIKDYLISLGFHVDNSSLNAARRAMGTAESSVSSFGSTSLTNFAKAGAAVTSFVVVANVALAKFMSSLGEADLRNEMFARRMWMNVDAARAFQASINALGVSVQDLYLSPELMQKYVELRKEASEMAVPSKEYAEQMKTVRSITFEFQRLKLEGTYALQWIGYYLTKYLAGPMGDAKNWLSKINDIIQQKMPEWSKKIAMVASWLVRMGVAAWHIRDAIGAIVLAFMAFKMVNMLSNPFGLMILGLTALLILIDDYLAFEKDKSGKNSYFNDLWRWIEKLKGSMKDSGIDLDGFRKSIDNIWDSVKGLRGAISDLLEILGGSGGLSDFLGSGIIATLNVLKDTLGSIAGLMTIIFSAATFDGEGISKGFDLFMNGLPKGFYENGKGIIDAFNDGNKQTSATKKYLYPQSNSSTATQITLKPTYNIHGATNPNAVVTTINRSNKGMITRVFRGVIG